MTRPLLPADVANALVDPKAYSQWDSLHDKFAWARANMPLGVAENDNFRPFWAVTRHAGQNGASHPAAGDPRGATDRTY